MIDPVARLAYAVLTALSIAALAGCSFPGQPDPQHRPIAPDQVVDFDALFARSCVGCHGSNGKLGPAPPLNDPIFLSIVPDEVLLDVITNGREGTPMPAFAHSAGGTLTEAQVEILAKGLKAKWKPKYPPVDNIPPYTPVVAAAAKPPEMEAKPGGEAKPPVDSAPPPAPIAPVDLAALGDPEQGAELFVHACAGCHGPQGQGIAAESGVIQHRLNDPNFLALISDQALRRIIITGRPDLEPRPMPDFASGKRRPKDFRPLTEADVTNLVAYLARWRTSPVESPIKTAGRAR